MVFEAKIIRILISSPGDITEERSVIINVIDQWNSINAMGSKIVLLPVFWERDGRPELGDRPQALLNKQIVQSCDILIATFWTRLGTPTGVSVSGTVEEIEEFLKDKKDVLIYFSSKNTDPYTIKSHQFEELNKFKENLKTKGLYYQYDSISKFEKMLMNNLSKTIQDKFVSPDIKKLSLSGITEKTSNHDKPVYSKENPVDDLITSRLKYIFQINYADLSAATINNKDNGISQLNLIKEKSRKIQNIIENSKINSPSTFQINSDQVNILIKNFSDLINHKIYMDGGKSYDKFWEKVNKTLENFRLFIELM